MSLTIEGINISVFRKLFDKLSLPILKVTGSLEHILDRIKDRNIKIETVLQAMAEIVNRKELCIQIYETVLAGGAKNFKVNINGLKVYYSIYVKETEKIPIEIRFRTVI